MPDPTSQPSQHDIAEESVEAGIADETAAYDRAIADEGEDADPAGPDKA